MHDLLLALTGALTGVLVGTSGMGGGSLMTPMLILLFGFSPTTAVGTDILHGAIFKSFGAWRHGRLGNIDRQLVLWLSIGSVPASVLGVLGLHWLERQISITSFDSGVNVAVGTSLLVVAALMVGRLLWTRRNGSGATADIPPRRPLGRRRWAALAIGILGGLIVGLTSIGSGTLIGMALLVAFPMRMRRMVGTDIANAALLLWASGIAHWAAGDVSIPTVGFLLIGSVPGVLLGAQCSSWLPERPMRVLLAVVLAASGAKLAGAGTTTMEILVATVFVVLAVLVASHLRSRRTADVFASRSAPVAAQN